MWNVVVVTYLKSNNSNWGRSQKSYFLQIFPNLSVLKIRSNMEYQNAPVRVTVWWHVCPNCHIIYILDKWFWAFLYLASRPSFCQNPQSGIIKTKLPFLHEVFFYCHPVVFVDQCLYLLSVRTQILEHYTFNYLLLHVSAVLWNLPDDGQKRPKRVVDANWTLMF